MAAPAFFGSGRIFRWEFEKRGQELAVDVRLTTNGPHLMVQAPRAGFGLAYVNDEQLTEDLKSKRLIRVLEDWTPLLGPQPLLPRPPPRTGGLEGVGGCGAGGGEARQALE
jgi:DNA-binding transcriptional LysR family regulator